MGSWQLCPQTLLWGFGCHAAWPACSSRSGSLPVAPAPRIDAYSDFQPAILSLGKIADKRQKSDEGQMGNRKWEAPGILSCGWRRRRNQWRAPGLDLDVRLRLTWTQSAPCISSGRSQSRPRALNSARVRRYTRCEIFTISVRVGAGNARNSKTSQTDQPLKATLAANLANKTNGAQNLLGPKAGFASCTG